MIDMHTVYLSLGANIGDRCKTINQAIDEIQELIGAVVRQSAFYETAPWGFKSDSMFVNAVVCCMTSLTPHQLLGSTQKIERELGRTEKSVHGEYHDRIIDIDILLYDNVTVDEPELKIPHPLMYQRDFVMKPLNEILHKKTES
jgi:2-amino-4-hydroxy-6-hydroxymethyldihydropteridine diphosphokinase